ncbi:hypothetical protein [Pseudomonas putida]|uniref:hypothetical protein n=1 Tax=Pseudomonas putida TaxID=303 RepID=UPI002167B7B9|nr:hypothetical protein [Pseudomonas putida]MCS4061708.1 hypothetical protein [Pseudomonas putida]
MKSRSLIYEAVVREVKQEIYVEGLVYGIVDDSTKDGDRMTTHRLRKAWIETDGIGAVDSQGNEFLVIDVDVVHPAVIDRLHLLFALALLSSEKPSHA